MLSQVVDYTLQSTVKVYCGQFSFKWYVILCKSRYRLQLVRSKPYVQSLTRKKCRKTLRAFSIGPLKSQQSTIVGDLGLSIRQQLLRLSGMIQRLTSEVGNPLQYGFPTTDESTGGQLRSRVIVKRIFSIESQ